MNGVVNGEEPSEFMEQLSVDQTVWLVNSGVREEMLRLMAVWRRTQQDKLR